MPAHDTPHVPLSIPSRYDPESVPPELVRTCIAGDCVLFAGAGFGLRAGYPNWRDTLRQVLSLLGTQDQSLQLADLKVALGHDQLRLVADLLTLRVGQDRVVAALRTCYERAPRYADLPLYSLTRIPFSSVLTTGWDRMWESVYSNRNPALLHLRGRAETSDGLLRPDSFEVVRLYGSLDTPESVVLTRDEYRSVVHQNPRLQKTLNSLVSAKSLLFMGTRTEMIEDFFGSLQFGGSGSRTHYALVASDSDTLLQAEYLWQRFRVRVLTFDEDAEWQTIGNFLQALADAVMHVASSAPEWPMHERLPLQRVVLSNIGAFESLDVELTEGWNVVLGNNGSGKSTILRAIALGLCGDDPEAAQSGRRLLRTNCDNGRIELTIGGAVYRTELTREPDAIRVHTTQITPLNAGYWAAFGFPPMRGVSEVDPRGPGGDGRPNPSTEDVIPLLRGGADQRLSNLKQWVVNLDVRSRTSDAPTGAASRHAHLLNTFFSILERFTPGNSIRFAEVDQATWQVWVVTDDGMVPIDQISQGMSSIVGWVGTLVQRMYEIYPDSEAPHEQPALVLVDEIDAHLHPEWQQQLVRVVKDVFPSVQVVATTHSPLLIAGLEAKELLISHRPEQGAAPSVRRAPFDPVGLRADQILTSPLFGLTRTRDDTLQVEYDELLALEEPTPAQTERMEQLAELIAPMMLTGDSALERAVQSTVRQTLENLHDSPDDLIQFLQGGLSNEAVSDLSTTFSTFGPGAHP